MSAFEDAMERAIVCIEGGNREDAVICLLLALVAQDDHVLGAYDRAGAVRRALEGGYLGALGSWRD